MNSRQRVLSVLNHHVPDRVPIDFGGFHSGIHIKAYTELIDYLGIEDNPRILDPVQQLAEPCEELLRRFNADIRYVCPNVFLECDSQGNFTDEFGITWIKQDKQNYMTISRHPLADVKIADIESYSFPNGNDKSSFAGIRDKALKISNDGLYALSTNIGGSLFECCCNLRALERWFIDMIENPHFCESLLDKVLEYWMNYYTELLSEIGDVIDIVMIGDDLAGQNGPLFSMNFYRDILKPRHKKLIQQIKSLTSAKICYHSCGSYYEFIPELIDIGIDILNPVQVGLKNMEPQKIKDEFGNQISLWGGGIDSGYTLALSNPAEIRKNVHRNLEIFKPSGGYIFSNDHNIQFDVPPKNIVALFDAAYEFSFYN